MAAPNFLVHQTTNVNDMKASKSQRKGIRVSCQKIGEINTFRIPHSAAQTATAAKSRVVKYGIVVTLFYTEVTPSIKALPH